MSVLAPNPQILNREWQWREAQQRQLMRRSGGRCLLGSGELGIGRRGNDVLRRDLRAKAMWYNSNLSRASMTGMEPINDSEELNQILVGAQDQSQAVLIDWMASWCRKCIYLKPKLEKLATEYETKVKFYYVDVNKVPQALVKRGNISKMPTIQLWKDGEMKAEVIGGHKAWLVIEEVREMIQKFI